MGGEYSGEARSPAAAARAAGRQGGDGGGEGSEAEGVEGRTRQSQQRRHRRSQRPSTGFGREECLQVLQVHLLAHSRGAIAAHHDATTRTGTTTRNPPVEASRKARESCGSGSDSAPLRRKGALPCPL